MCLLLRMYPSWTPTTIQLLILSYNGRTTRQTASGFQFKHFLSRVTGLTKRGILQKRSERPVGNSSTSTGSQFPDGSLWHPCKSQLSTRDQPVLCFRSACTHFWWTFIKSLGN